MNGFPRTVQERVQRSAVAALLVAVSFTGARPVVAGSSKARSPHGVVAAPTSSRTAVVTPPRASSAVVPSADFETTQVSDAVYTFRWHQHRNMFVVTPDGVIVTDPISPEAALVLQGEIRRITDRPVRYVVYSHDHWDHILGGVVFKRAGAKFVSHARCLASFEARPHPDLVLPDVTFTGNAYDLHLGGVTLELRYFGPNHGEGLIVMLLTSERLLYIVDLVSPGAVGFRILPDYDPVELIRTLREIEAQLEFDRIIPGHMAPVAPASAVAQERHYYERLMEAVGEAWQRGVRDPGELVQRIELRAYADWYGYDEWLPLNVERIWAYYHMGW